MKLSILTATYNRGELLKRVYKSIMDNLNCPLEVEWIIIDDGSVDNTKNVIKRFKEENKFEVKYIWQENLGKMSAINKGIKYATGELIVDCDSDDYFVKNSFKTILENSSYLLSREDIYAMCFLKSKENGKISGNRFKRNYLLTTMFDIYFKDNIGGEKILVFNSNIRKKFSHEIERGEKFITESRMYHKMDEKYKILCINKIIEEGEYLEDGYTKNIDKTFKTSPKGYNKYFKEIMQKNLKGVNLRKRLYIIKNYLLTLNR